MRAADDPCAIILDFLAGWDVAGGFVRSVGRYFTEETIYENIGMSRTRGIAEACAFFESFAGGAGCDRIGVRTLTIAAQGNSVLTERIDDVKDATGALIFSLPVMGVFELASGKILAWRDYFDTGGLPPYHGPGAIARPVPAA